MLGGTEMLNMERSRSREEFLDEGGHAKSLCDTEDRMRRLRDEDLQVCYRTNPSI